MAIGRYTSGYLSWPLSLAERAIRGNMYDSCSERFHMAILLLPVRFELGQLDLGGYCTILGLLDYLLDTISCAS